MTRRVSPTGSRWFRAQGPTFAVALFATIIAGGTVGYMLVEGWSAWDAFYMTVITVTTVGYQEVHALSTAGQAFTVVLLLGGVGAALYTFTLLATLVVEGGLPKQLARRRQARMLDTIRDHFIVCGYGRIGSIVARQFLRQRVPIVVIERDADRLQIAMEDGVLAVEADASREEVLKRVGIDRARGLVATMGTDAENVYAVLSARVLRPDLFIVGRAETEDATTKLRRAGADRVISPYQIGAVHIAQTALRPAVVDFVELATSADNLDLAMEEVQILAGSPLAERSLVDTDLRHRFGVIVVGIQRFDRQMEFNPAPDVKMHVGDKLVVLGRAESLKQLEGEGIRHMRARVLDGAAVASQLRGELRPAVEAFTARAGRPPGLGIVLVGDDPASQIYVTGKLKSATETGLRADLERLPASASLGTLLAVVDRLNRSEVHDGILVQAPLPDAMGRDAERQVFDALDPAKDVDGFHPRNVGLLVQNRAALVACTPSGVIEMLERLNVPIAGTRAVVIGRSDIVGKPMALLLLHRHATVTICHSRTPDLAATAAHADLVVAAIGRPAFVTAEFVKPGATVVDVGINRLTDRASVERIFAAGAKARDTFARRGSVVVGDVHPEVAEVAGALTPVPGGVGPLTIAMLLKNTVRAAEGRVAFADLRR